jgi:hypothetical protein
MLTIKRLSRIYLLIALNTARVAMILHEDYSALVERMRDILSELDRLQLPIVAVHVDMAISLLETFIAEPSPGDVPTEIN